MRSFWAMPMVLGLALIATSGSLRAQTLTPGTWTGSTAKDNGEVSKLTFDVAGTGDSTSITINNPEGNSFSVLAVRVTNDSLTFTLPFGVDVKCALARQTNGTFFGGCSVGGEGQTSTLEMIPPGRE